MSGMSCYLKLRYLVIVLIGVEIKRAVVNSFARI